ncbi:hypothetical protein E6W39_00130 [Kitasatospora acidiphila]|uniref:Uncharacterized protein n=1 Tax=Kitasatospora acidiphila TaxID=2567942 RepID=A0A540WGI3_9ACTN|nr:hypothetical protein [Kitasatospora acidiphila]TQF08007.1 hypothetical protein E6W39_00130 [Kitasatospora acidiphila]
MAELPAIAGADRATTHRYFDDFALRRLPAALARARQDTVTAAMAPLAEMFADADATGLMLFATVRRADEPG